MALISENYKDLNEQLHKDSASYGTSGKRWAMTVAELAVAMGTRDILDYGCGKGTLGQNLPFKIREYDPAVSGKDKKPEPADLVVCTDVMEHIEPDHIESVLDHLEDLVVKGGFFVVATRPAKKTLADGRNAHLIQEDIRWWLPKLWARFDIVSFQDMGGEFMVVVEAK